MKSKVCKHRFNKIENTTFQWCQYCGVVYYKYQINNDFFQTFFNPTNIRDLQHKKHEWFKLSSTNYWCVYCGTLLVIRLTTSGNLKAGYLKPYISVAHKQILHEAGLCK